VPEQRPSVRIESGAAKSVSDAARQLGDETGRSPETIRTAIQREESRTASLTQLAGTAKHAPKPQQDIPIIALGEKEILTKAKEIEGVSWHRQARFFI
jgi:hypothetical protein